MKKKTAKANVLKSKDDTTWQWEDLDEINDIWESLKEHEQNGETVCSYTVQLTHKQQFEGDDADKWYE